MVGNVKRPKCFNCKGGLIIVNDHLPCITFRCTKCSFVWLGYDTKFQPKSKKPSRKVDKYEKDFGKQTVLETVRGDQ